MKNFNNGLISVNVSFKNSNHIANKSTEENHLKISPCARLRFTNLSITK